MSTTTFESSIKQIPHKQESVYNTLSDLNNLQRLKDRFEQVKDQISEDKRKEMEKLKDLKFETENSPVPFNFWIQLLPTSDTACKMKLTIKADLNPFIKGMVKKPLEEGIEKIANALAMISYED